MSPNTPESVIITPSQEDVDKVRGYRIGQWNQYKNYECIYCQYSTLFIDKMAKHQAEDNHPWAYPGQNVPDADIDETVPIYE